MLHLGWGKKLSYCIAFSADGCCDVTRRYVRDPAAHALPRNKCPEGALLHIIREINALRRQDMDKKQKFQLNAEDMREDAELRRFVIESLAWSVSRILPGGGEKGARIGGADVDAQKAAEGREADWLRTTTSSARGGGEASQQQQPPPPRDHQRQP